MRPPILIIEPHREMADAFEEVIASAHFTPLVRPYVENLSDVGISPAAIVVRVALEGALAPPHQALTRLSGPRPPVVAIAWSEEEIAEAHRLGCEVVLRAPHEVKRLCEALASLI